MRNFCTLLFIFIVILNSFKISLQGNGPGRERPLQLVIPCRGPPEKEIRWLENRNNRDPLPPKVLPLPERSEVVKKFEFPLNYITLDENGKPHTIPTIAKSRKVLSDENGAVVGFFEINILKGIYEEYEGRGLIRVKIDEVLKVPIEMELTEEQLFPLHKPYRLGNIFRYPREH